MPIKEAATIGDDFMIKGIAINETTTRNGIKYIASELDKAAASFRNKPILLDHVNSVKNIVGRTTENVVFDFEKKGITFEAKIMDKEIQKMINDGRIQEVSIGASVKDLVESEEDNSKTAIGLEGMEISLVAVPGDPGASLAMAMDNSFQIREALESQEDFIDDLELESIKLNGGIDMAEQNEQKEQLEVKTEVEAIKPTEEKINVNVDMSGVQNQIAELSKQIAEMLKVKEQESEEEPTDETKGEVVSDEEKEEPEVAEEGYVVEQAETGKGFSIWRDYSKTPGKFKRLAR